MQIPFCVASVKEMWSKYSPDLNDEPKSKRNVAISFKLKSIVFTTSNLFTLYCLKKPFTLAHKSTTDGDDVGKSDSDDQHISNSDVDEDRHHIDILPSAPLSQLDLAYKSGGEDAARQLLQSQPIEQV